MAPTGTTAPPPPTSTPPPPFGRDTRRLRRSSSDRYLGGVAGGIGAFLGIDPNIVRIALMVLSIMSLGSILVAYLAAWVLLPDTDDDEAPALRWYREHAPGPGRPLATAGLLVLGALALTTAWSIAWGWESGSFPALVVIGVLAIAVLSRHDHGRRPDDAPEGGDDDPGPGPRPGPDPIGGSDDPTSVWGTEPTVVVGEATAPDPRSPADAPTAIEPWTGAVTTVAPPAGAPASDPSATTATARRREHPRRDPDPEAADRRRRHGMVRNAVVVGAAGAGGIAAALWATETGAVAGWTVPAVVFVVLLAGLATTPIWGWSWTVALLAVLVVPFLLVAAVPGVTLRGGVGYRHDRPAAVADLQDRYRLGVGHQDLDLTALDLAPGSTTVVQVETGIGRTEVQVPASVDLELRGRLGGGTVYVDDEPSGIGGTDVAFHRAYPAAISAAGRSRESGRTPTLDTVDPPTLVLETTTGIGSLEVDRVA